MKCITLLMILIILPIQSSHSSYTDISTMKKSIVNRTLSVEELKAPYSYLNRSWQITSIQASYSAPFNKPVIEWKQVYKNAESTDVMVDSQGFIWLVINERQNPNSRSTETNRSHWNKVIRLNKEGNICFRKYLYCLELKLVTINNNSIVIYRMFEESRNMLPHKWDTKITRFFTLPENKFIDLECYDFDGNLLWRTEPEPIGISYITSKRLSNDSVLLSVGEIAGEYNQYSLSDGALVNKLVFLDWDNNIRGWGPIEILTPGNEGWIGVKRGILVRYDTELNAIREIPDEYLTAANPPLVTPHGLLVYYGLFNMTVLDLNSGDTVYKEYPDGEQIGLTNDGNIIMVDNRNKNLRILDGTNGEVVKELSNSNAFMSLSTSIIVYQDNSIVIGIGNNQSIAYTKYDGTESWVLDVSSIGIPQRAMVYSCLIPSSDSRIILACEYDDLDHYNRRTILVSLGPDD